MDFSEQPVCVLNTPESHKAKPPSLSCLLLRYVDVHDLPVFGQSDIHQQDAMMGRYSQNTAVVDSYLYLFRTPFGEIGEFVSLSLRWWWGVWVRCLSMELSKRNFFFLENENASVNLFAMAVGINQSDLVDAMVKKFVLSNFSVMLFHYDGIVDEWKKFEWNERVIHVSAHSQTKWWFAKRFLHPDIVAKYSYIFLWDEDLGVENFNPQQYVKIVKSEGLEISQPALDPQKSEIHQQITARIHRSVVHRRTIKTGLCDHNSTAPPCTGWVEMMAPVFTRAAWRCVWYMIQGDRTKNVGIVDSEYIVHHGRPTLGSVNKHKITLSNDNSTTPNAENITNALSAVRRQSFTEFKIFQNRWIRAVDNDPCWVDPHN
ncbi:hypothetical protein Tsubulata_022822 [Turnera subulata]|uniref:Uncharacterized protein n=1 Tax=Turnera subulata TaxID=218843 RepID=A0A9Q0FMC9_9ROSI|nr:hypothetical protein Tsubulata_022822 [Turnera subulata]